MSADAPGVILTKATLPDLPDYEIIRLLRQSPAGRNVPVVAMIEGRDGYGRAREAGAAETVKVPDDYNRLPAIIRRLLAGSSSSASC